MTQPYLLLPPTGAEQADEWIKLALEAQVAGRPADAEKHYHNALRIVPGHVIATHNLGILLAQTGNINEGLLYIERAGIFDGIEPIIAGNRALMNLAADRLDEAKAAAEHSLTLAQDLPPKEPKTTDEMRAVGGYLLARMSYAMTIAACGEPDKAIAAYREMLAVDPKHGAAAPNVCFVQSLTPCSPKELADQRRQWYEAHKSPAQTRKHENDKEPSLHECVECKGKGYDERNEECGHCNHGIAGRPLRVGYVGGDFKQHSAAMIFANVLLNHSAAVEPYFYSSLPVQPEIDGLTKKFQETAGPRWRDIGGKTDEEVDEMIRRDGIDILVDLAAHTNGGRLGVFMRKPAPIQITAWGFAHGTGCPEVDAFFADLVAIPKEERQHYVERIIDLPCIVTYRPPDEYGIKASSQLPYYRNDYITFGNFSRFEKLSDECLSMFAEILKRVPDSRLYLKDNAFKRPYSVRRVLKALAGIDKSRVMFGVNTSHQEHLQTYQQCDLCLDPWPHGGGVVSLETLYTGVPLITRYGTQPAGRTASSVLTAMGRTDWIARTADEYVNKAVEWANRPADLAKARKTLREELINSPVVKGYAGAVEEAYRKLWKEWCGKS